MRILGYGMTAWQLLDMLWKSIMHHCKFWNAFRVTSWHFRMSSDGDRRCRCGRIDTTTPCPFRRVNKLLCLETRLWNKITKIALTVEEERFAEKTTEESYPATMKVQE